MQARQWGISFEVALLGSPKGPIGTKLCAKEGDFLGTLLGLFVRSTKGINLGTRPGTKQVH